MSSHRGNPLWLILVETAQTLPLYPAHKAYIRDKILPENPDVTPEELARILDMPLGEAIVILDELNEEQSG